MNIIHDNANQDRIVEKLYVWICVDPATGLEGIASLLSPVSPRAPMQAVTSSLENAHKMGELYQVLARESGKKFYLTEFNKGDILQSLYFRGPNGESIREMMK